jgi:hypothetical protein
LIFIEGKMAFSSTRSAVLAMLIFTSILLLKSSYYVVEALACIQEDKADTTCTGANGTCTDAGFCLYDASTNTCGVVDGSIGDCGDVSITDTSSDECGCGEKCTTDEGAAGLCQTDGTCSLDENVPAVPIGSRCTDNAGCETGSCLQNFLPPDFPSYCYCNSKINVGCPADKICRHLDMILGDIPPECYIPIGSPCKPEDGPGKCESQYCNPESKLCECSDTVLNYEQIPGCADVNILAPGNGIKTSFPLNTPSNSPTEPTTQTPTAAPTPDPTSGNAVKKVASAISIATLSFLLAIV